ncbi:MAG: pyridoxamine 5'-phosphate oxidase family protein [Candidatus Heimdallarchaeota archaeon]
MTEITADMENFLQEQRMIRVATVAPDGSPNIAPFCFFMHEGTVHVLTRPETKTVKNIKNNPKVAFLIDSYDEDWSKNRFLMLKGVATLIEDSKRTEELRAARKAKYPQQADAPPDRKWTVIRINPTTVLPFRI